MINPRIYILWFVLRCGGVSINIKENEEEEEKSDETFTEEFDNKVIQTIDSD